MGLIPRGVIHPSCKGSATDSAPGSHLAPAFLGTGAAKDHIDGAVHSLVG